MTAPNAQNPAVLDPSAGRGPIVAIGFTGAVFGAAWLSMALSARMFGVSPIWLATGLAVGILVGRSRNLAK